MPIVKSNYSPHAKIGLPFSRRANPFQIGVPAQSGPQIFGPHDAPIKSRRFSPMVVLLMGRRDAGKTYSMTVSAAIQKERYHHHGVDFKIGSNFQLAFADYKGQHIVDEIMMFPPWFRDMFLCLDEIQTALNNRRAMGRSAIGLTTMLSMIRKRRVDCVFTTQFPQTIDPAALYQCDLFIEIETSPDRGIIRFNCHDWWGQYTGMNWRKPWPPRVTERDWYFDVHVPNPWKMFQLYDTDEVIASMYLGEESRERMIAEQSLEKGWSEELPVVEAMEIRAEDIRNGLDPVEEARRAQTLDDVMSVFKGEEVQVTAVMNAAKDARVVGPNVKVLAVAEQLESLGYTVEQKGKQRWVKTTKASL